MFGLVIPSVCLYTGFFILFNHSKSYNMKTVNVEIPINMMTDQLESVISSDFPHRELLAEAIINSLEDSNKLKFLHMALNGVRPTVKVNIFDAVVVSTRVFKGDKFEPIGKCYVIDVNPYGYNQVKVSYESVDVMGNPVTTDAWIPESDITDIISPDPDWDQTSKL